jgi:hypothetical protein
MTITYTWNIGPLECIPSENGLNNIVKVVHWRYIGNDGNNHTSSVYGSVSVGDPDPNNFIQFANLTLDTVVSWITPKLDLNMLANNINIAIENEINPPVVNQSPPWSSNVVSNTVSNTITSNTSANTVNN